MKRAVKSLFAALISMFMLLSAAAAADTTTYTLDELDMEISVPNELVVFTRDLDDSDLYLSLFGLEKESFLNTMISSDIYLSAVDMDTGAEVVVTMTENEVSNFNLLSDAELSALQENLDSIYQDLGRTYLGSEIYRHHQATFVKINFTTPDPEMPINSLQYYTIYANKAINITLHSYNDAISTEQALMLQNIVNSAAFGLEPQLPEPDFIPTEAFLYQNDTLDISFTVPANWVQDDSLLELDGIDAAFISSEDPSLAITYSRIDAYEEFTALEKLLCPRGQVDNSIITLEEFAEDLPVISSHTVTFNGREYYCLQVDYSETAPKNPFTQLAYIRNGYYHLFQFSRPESSPYYADFEALMDSVEYTDYTSPLNLVNILFSLLLTIMVYTVPIVIYRYAIRKSNDEPKKARKITIL